MEIKYLDALAGAGKTFAASRQSIKAAKYENRKTIIAVPTRTVAEQVEKLARQHAAEFKAKAVLVTRITGDTDEHPVRVIMAHLKESARHPDRGELLIVTHAGLNDARYWHGADRWDLIIDEVPSVDMCWAENLPETHHLLTDHVRIEYSDGLYGRLAPKDEAAARHLTAIAENRRGDRVWQVLQDVARELTTKGSEVWVLLKNWSLHLSGDMMECPADDPQNPLWVFGIRHPGRLREFRSVTIMAANFTDTLCYYLWSTAGVQFRPIQPVGDWKLQYDRHDGSRLTIRWVHDGEWSKSRGERLCEAEGPQGKLTQREYALQQVSCFDGQPFCYLANKDNAPEAAKIFEGLPAEPLPYSPHGDNAYRHHHNVAVIAAFLHHPDQCAFFAARNINSEDLRNAVHRQTVYQAALRCSLRVAGATEQVTILVPDQATAEWLAGLFPGCQIGRVGTAPTYWRRGRKHGSLAAKQQAYRTRQAELRYKFDSRLLAQFGEKLDDVYGNRYDCLYRPYKGNCNDCHTHAMFFPGTVFAHKKDHDINRTRLSRRPWSDFVAEMRELYEAQLPKERLHLISPSYFVDQPDPDVGPGKLPRRRGRNNVVLAHAIWLDFEKGVLTYEALSGIFPDLEMLGYSTVSAEDATRFRAVLPLSRPVNADQYGHIIKKLKRSIEIAGYASRPGLSRPFHGLDQSKLGAENLMYLPGRPKNPAYAGFFEHRPGQPIDVEVWCANGPFVLDEEAILAEANPPPAPADEEPANPHTEADAVEVEITRQLDRIRPNVGNRNNDLYGASKRLQGLVKSGQADHYEVVRRLEQKARECSLTSSEIRSTIDSARRNARPWRVRLPSRQALEEAALRQRMRELRHRKNNDRPVDLPENAMIEQFG